MTSFKPVMSESEIKQRQAAGDIHCIVEVQSDGELCWDVSDTQEREPVHKVKKGERLWCWNFKSVSSTYSHEFGNMSGGEVIISTNTKLKLVYITNDVNDPALFETELEKGPNVT